MTSLSSTITLHNGVEMPILGLGTYDTAAEITENSVKWALEAGYRMIDTAAIYRNEGSVAAGIRASGVPREEVFITTKLFNTDQGYDKTLYACERSLRNLSTDYIDLYLIHWPGSDPVIAKDGKKYLDTWRAMEKLYADKKVRAIGFSNFHEKHIEDILAMCTVAPMVDQVEINPQFTQVPLRAYCKSKNIAVTAWSPLGQGKLLQHPTLQTIAAKYSRSPAQVILRWDVQNGVIAIPKSTKEERIYENGNVFGFELANDEMEQINAMHTGERIGPDPETTTYVYTTTPE